MIIYKLIVSFALFVCYDSSMFNETIYDEYKHQNYSIKSVQEIKKYRRISENLETASSENRDFLKNEFEHVFPNSISPIFDLLDDTNSSKCYQDLKYVFQNLLNQSWANEMLDSFGKLESGILQGNLKWLGNYDQCLKVYAPPDGKTGAGDFHGKYCLLQIDANGTLEISTGICLPDSCNSSISVYDVLKKVKIVIPIFAFVEQYKSELNDTKLSCQQIPEKFTSGGIFVIFLISIFVFVSIVGSSITAYEYFTEINAETEKVQDFSEKPSTSIDAGNMSVEQQNDLAKDNKLNTLQDWLEKSKPFFKCFCWFTNGEKLINTSTAEGQLPCLHGIRFLSMSWVMLGHVYSFSFPYLKNTTEALIMGDQWIFQIILRGSYSVDSFFVLSGFLVAYLFFQQYAKSKGKIPWLYFYIHRYIRLTPVYMMFLAFYTTLMAYLGSGPLWNYKETDPNCQAYWWWNLLYFNNFLTAANQCIPWSWYLANDMQFYIISPLLMVSLMRWPVIGYSLMGVFFGITFISNFCFAYVFNYPIGLTNVVKQFENFKEFSVIWTHRFDTNTKPYIRMDPYLVGIALAYYLFKRKQNNSGKLSLVTLSVGWVVASVVTLATVFGIYHQEPNIVITSFYTAVNRSCYACGLAWVIFVCVIGQGGVVNSFLSWKFWIPLSRLTFCAYLVHPLIQTTYFASLRDSIVCSHMTMVMYHFGFLIMSYMAALVVSLLFESPVIRLERLIRNKFTS